MNGSELQAASNDAFAGPQYLELKEPLIVLTVPKSGTHLIANILRELFGASNVPPMLSVATLPDNLADAPLIYHTHFPYSVEASLALRKVRKVLQVRDPRDVAVSYMRSIYTRKISPDPAQNYLLQHGFGPEEVLSFIIQGGTADHTTYPDIGTLYRRYFLGWRSTTDLVVRYEDLLPDGQDFAGPAAAIRELLERLEIEIPDGFPLQERVRAGSDPGRSATFDRGQSGGWRGDFAPVHHALLHSVAPTLLTDLGYEESGNRAADPGTAPGGGGGRAERRSKRPAAGDETVQPGVDPVARRQLIRLEALLARLKSLDDHVPQRAGLIKFSTFNLWLFVWVDDAIQKTAGTEVGTNAHLTALRERPETPTVTMPLREWSPTVELCRVALANYPHVHFVDIGCCYGLETMLVAGMLDQHRDRLSITAFDCGLAGRLAPASFDLNGFGERIGFRSEAVTAWDASTLVFGTYGSMENMRIVNNNVARDTVSYPVAGVRLDTAFADLREDTKLVVKMHIQGGEFLALQGAKRLFDDDRIAAVVVAFAPHALATTDAPGNLLQYVPEDWLVYDLGPNQWLSREPPQPLSAAAFPEFAANLTNANVTHTFLLLHRPDLDLGASLFLARANRGREYRRDRSRPAPSAQQLAELVNDGRHLEAAALIYPVEPDEIADASAFYYGGVALGSVGEEARAIVLLRRALDGGYAPFWCAYHLGLFEMELGNAANAAFYYVASLVREPERTDIHPLLARVAPDFDRAVLEAARAGGSAPETVKAAVRAGIERTAAGSSGSAVGYFTVALVLDPEHADARVRLRELAPDVSLGVLAGVEPGGSRAAAGPAREGRRQRSDH